MCQATRPISTTFAPVMRMPRHPVGDRVETFVHYSEYVDRRSTPAAERAAAIVVEHAELPQLIGQAL